MHEEKEEFEHVEAFLLDMDGVIYLEDSPIEGSVEAVNELRNREYKTIFLTNNSTKSRKQYRSRLSRMGLEVEDSEIMTSARATAVYLSEEVEGGSCYVLGEDGLRRELREENIDIVPSEDPKAASHVVVGMDRGINYEKIKGALDALLSGAEFIGTNPDPTFPTEDGLAPGAGSCIGAVSGAIERGPSVIIGKPSEYMLEISLEKIGTDPSKTVIVGDRLSTDMRVGNKMGLVSVLVLSGATNEEDLRDCPREENPDYVFDSISEMVGRVVE